MVSCIKGGIQTKGVCKRIFGPKSGEWRRLHNEELHSSYRSPNIVRAIKSRRLRWAGHVVRMEGGRSAFKVLTGRPADGVDGRTILEWILKK